MLEEQVGLPHSQKKGIESTGASHSEPCRILLLTTRIERDSRRAGGGAESSLLESTERVSIVGLPAKV
jgi:hypothetical protein